VIVDFAKFAKSDFAKSGGAYREAFAKWAVKFANGQAYPDRPIFANFAKTGPQHPEELHRVIKD
jgi:hypothetical protein